MIKPFKNSYLLIFICFSIISNCFSQQYNFKNYSVESGLPYVQIFAMFQDSKGNLWSGGYGGASKFNGKTFQNYSPKNGLANHYVNAIIEDQFNIITVGTIDGLSVIDKVKGRVDNFYEKDGLPSNNVTSFCVDNKNGLWTGTTKGLCVWDGKKVSQINFFKSKFITSLKYSQNYGVLVGTTQGLYIQKANSSQFIKVLDSVTVNSLSINNETHKLYVATNTGLHLVNLKDFSHQVLHIHNGLLDENVSSVVCQENGIVWIGSKTGLVSFDGKEFSYYNVGPDNNSNHIRSLLIDYEGNLWIGTHNGLFKFRGKGFSVFDRQQGLAGAFIYQITRDVTNNLWIATENNGVYKYANGFFKNYSVKQGMAGNLVHAILPFEDGTIWFGGEHGVSVYKNDQITKLNLGNNDLATATINTFYKDRKGIIWVGVKNGVFSIKRDGNNYIVEKHILPINSKENNDYETWSFIEDNNGTLWTGTYLAGLYKYDNNKFIKTTEIPEIISTALEMCKDNYGNIYAATLNGVLMFNPLKQKYKIISEKEGLSSELVYTIGITKDKKYLWAGTNQGVNKINIEKLQYDIIDIIHYGKEDGFTGVESNTHGIFIDDDKCIWFGTVNGLIKYDPKEFIINDNFSKTSIVNFKLGYVDTLLQNNVALPYNLNNISIYFDGICLTDPQKVKFTFKLEGFDKEWSPPNDINYAKYDNLPPGKYTFKVKSCNNEGLWNIEPVEFSFSISTPYFKTWWFILSVIAVSAGLVIGIFRLRLYQLQKIQQEKFDQQIEISKAELKALRAQMNPHFVFNSLNSIQHYILNSKEEEAAKYLNKFAKLIRLILNNSEKTTVTINEDIEAITLYLELEKMRFDNKFTYSISIDDSIDGDYDEIPPMLIQPYLENAILHGINPKKDVGKIDLNISIVNQQFIKISIIDNGVGRKASLELNSIQPKAKHKSLGMKITKERVRIINAMHQSNLNVSITDLYDNNNCAIGTQVDIFVPYIK